MVDAQGLAEFDTIMPAWYHGRTTHIHIRIHSGNVTVEDGQLVGPGLVAHTGQLFFSDELVTALSKTRSPYNELSKSLKPILNGDDGIYLHSGGAEQVVSIEQDGDAFVGSVTVGIDPKVVHQEDDHGAFGERGRWWKVVTGTLIACALIACAAHWLLKFWTRRATRKGYAPPPADEHVATSDAGETHAVYRDEE